MNALVRPLSAQNGKTGHDDIGAKLLQDTMDAVARRIIGRESPDGHGVVEVVGRVLQAGNDLAVDPRCGRTANSGACVEDGLLWRIANGHRMGAPGEQRSGDEGEEAFHQSSVRAAVRSRARR